MDWIKAVRMWGLKRTYEKFYMLRVLKIGTLVGTDEHGNEYFENLDYPYGQHRWVEHKHWDNSNLVEPTVVPPMWHGWLHYSTDEAPVSNAQDTSVTGEAMVNATDNPFISHHNVAHTLAWTPNPTLKRERGYQVNTPSFSEVGENAFYTQPGHPQNPGYKPQTVDMDEWDVQPARATAGVAIKNFAYQEKWQKFYRLRQTMNESEVTRA